MSSTLIAWTTAAAMAATTAGPIAAPSAQGPVAVRIDAVASQPAATEPAATEPTATEPVATEPPATEPPATEPVPTETAPTEPAPTHASPPQPDPSWIVESEPAPAPAATAPAPAVPPPIIPMPPTTSAVDRPPPPAGRDGRTLMLVGGLSLGVGAASLLFVALPALSVRNIAQDRADREDALAFTSRETRYRRARRADDTMEAAFWIGAPLVVVGTGMLIAGLVLRNDARRSRLAAGPGGLTLRF